MSSIRMRVLRLGVVLVAACALVTLGCGARQRSRCGAFDSCDDGLRCMHGGPEDLGTCEIPCRDDAQCPADQHCEHLPLPDALGNVCAEGAPDAAGALVMVEVDLDPNDQTLVLVGPDIEVGQSYLIVSAHEQAQVMVVEGEPADCDDCTRPRHRTRWIHGHVANDAVGVGPVHYYRPASATRTHVDIASLGSEWLVESTVDLESDGTPDLEGVIRCGHETPSGCDGRVCDRVCRATRTFGETEIRGERCASFVPDVEDCLAPAGPSATN